MALSSFLTSTRFQVLGRISLGLIVAHGYERIGTSIDGLVLMYDSETSTTNSVWVEIKTAAALKTQQEAQTRLAEARRRTGSSSVPFFTTRFGSTLFQLLVPTPNHRAQLIHHAAVTDLQFGLYIVANQTRIVYCVLIEIPARRASNLPPNSGCCTSKIRSVD